ncbi:MAG: hypothetical protein ING91_19425 [Rhodocyclaceae bacterium]|nr:hypothetical protein [Rhodocyclaceae bacterium]MCA3116406.1 hypothetical protein [Rhodocyclaceae bacterium]MCA3129191.1 hypothetical protein [Rhodocyclaceae bacterium]
MKFRGVGPALVFAFRSHEVVEQSAVFRMRGPSRSSSDEPMGPFDLAAQAGSIRGIVERLREPSRSAVILRYAAGPERLAAYHALGPHALDNAMMGRAILALAHKSKHVTVGGVAQRLGVTVADVETARLRVERLLVDWTAEGESQVAAALRERGLIDGD